MKIKNNIGIVAYGTSIPSNCILTTKIEDAQNKTGSGIGQALRIKQKTVPDIDQDTITLATDAGLQALERFSANKKEINNIFIGSESHPYAVNPSGSVVAQALGLSNHVATADLQFACKAGTQALQIGLAYVQSGMSKFSLAIGADTAQAAPGDALEFSASSGSAAYIIGKGKPLVKILNTSSYVSDTPDFWRRPKQSYPQHGGRFTGQPAYFKHIMAASKQLLTEAQISPDQISHAVFHTPNGKFPREVASKLGFNSGQMKHSLIVEQIGNSYAAAVPLALANVLDHAKTGEKIFVCSYGSGAGADSFLLEVTDQLEKQRKNWHYLLAEQISNLKPVNYQQYQTNIHH